MATWVAEKRLCRWALLMPSSWIFWRSSRLTVSNSTFANHSSSLVTSSSSLEDCRRALAEIRSTFESARPSAPNLSGVGATAAAGTGGALRTRARTADESVLLGLRGWDFRLGMRTFGLRQVPGNSATLLSHYHE